MKKRIAAVSLAAVLGIMGSAVGLADAVVAPDVAEVRVMPYNPDSGLAVDANSKEDEKKMLEKLILFVKTNICDTDVYEYFNYDTYLNSYGNTVFNLTWNGEADSRPYMGVTIDSNEVVQSFYKYDNSRYDYQTQKKIEIPEFTKNDALDAALEFVKKIAPEYDGQVSRDFASVSVNRYYSSLSYSVTLYRVVNGIRVENEALYVDVDSKGEITSYSNYGTKNVSGEAPKDIAAHRTIVNAFKESLPLELKYIASYNYDTGKNTVRLAYVTPDYESKVVDAATGKVYELQYKADGSEDSGAKGGRGAYAPAAETANMDTAVQEEKSLSAVEQKAVDKHVNLLNADDIKAILKKYKELGFDDSYKLSSSYLNTSESSYSDKTVYYLSLSFNKKSDSGNYSYIYVDANAETGEIRSYSYNDSEYPVIPYPATAEERTALYKTYTSQEAAVKSAEKLLKEIYGAKFNEFKLDESSWGESDSYGYVTYTRFVNGIAFDGDQINVSFDRSTGKVTNIYFSYADDAVFPSADKKITSSQAIDKLFAEFPLNAYYKIYCELDEENSVMYYTYNSETEKNLALVYSYTEMSGVIVDAVSGDLYYRWGSEKATYTPIEYHNPNALDSVKDHKASKQITAIYSLGAIEIGKNFNADAVITVNEFENIVSGILNSGSYYVTPAKEGAEEAGTDIGSNPMTREDAVIKIVDMLGYGDIAKINDIFKEVKGADKNLTGYYAIANSLGLLNEISDDTKDGNLTYAGACCFIYNYILYTNAE